MKIFLIALLFILFCDIAFGSRCLSNPTCYCSTTAQKDTKIFCKNVTDITSIQSLLTRYPRVYSLRIIGQNLTDFPSQAFAGHIIIVLEIEAPLDTVADDALDGIFQLRIVNFDGGQFTTIPATFSNSSLRTVQLVHGSLDSIENQLQNNTQMTDALLYGNRITTISPDAFLNTKELQYLNLSNNLLTELDPGLLQQTQNLKSIDLSNNNLFTVDGCFDSLNPKGIRLYGNNLTNIDNAFHRGMWSMRWLDIGGNPYLNVTFSTFAGVMPYLTTLFLNDNNIQELDSYLLKNFKNLYKLCINGNHISSIPKYFFSATPRMSVLEIANNDLTSVEDLFSSDEQHTGIRTLKSVKLNGNKINSIKFESSAKSILYLDLSQNQINSVMSNDFENLTSVRKLNLSRNSLGTIEAGSFKALSKLQSLDLSFTGIKQLNKSVQQMFQLEELIIDSSSLTSIDKDDLIGLNSLQDLSVKNNNLISVYEALQKLTNLTSLDISGNKLETLTSDSLQSNEKYLGNLKEIWMANNPWTCDCRLSWLLDRLKSGGLSLEDDPICHTPSNLQGKAIHSLNLTDLQFWKEDCPLFCECMCIVDGENARTVINCANKSLDNIPDHFPNNAKEINLQDNNIITFNEIESMPLVNLQILKMAGNNLSKFTLDEGNISSHLSLISLSRNPWICDCEAWSFREWLIQHNNSVIDIENVRCSLDGKLSNRVIIQLNQAEMCPNLTNLVKIITIAGSIILVLLVCLVFCVCRRTLAALCYSIGCGCLKENERHDYSFDAFLLYANENEDFALSTIAEGLESRVRGIKLFIPTRQVFLTSSPVNIQSSLSDCCKVIVLFSRELLRSSECMQLLKASMSCSIENSSRRMIFLVLDEDALLHEADPTLKAVVSNSSTLRWKRFYSGES
ncbi:protein toll [Caerostris darwini]|uniref:Protein toll n=1 Tax=Caerostris darwini TaxID=1538125 RepID=A0AAV4QKI9_9ARAC|nr:protein toll [Caerostris darwini]